ncbi:zinc finger CCCH domain-containing protein 13-like [Trifolium pratense]|uniref:Zinc finger CCCH domain-containing protein 13-like n=1 Tax=Trifolium pratense TaxID=57577 RepID=A0A2K3PK53_TRIPR|nr:zinc finger CCCH domain-containing protein 13-like [Trifolium pratense]
MSHRDSDSKRRHSKFDREPSPKRYRRDGKQDREKERVINNDGGDNNHVDREHHSKREPPRSRSYYQCIIAVQPLPATRHAVAEKFSVASKIAAVADAITSHLRMRLKRRNWEKNIANRSLLFALAVNCLHDERDSTVQVGRSAGQRETDGKVNTQSKESNQRVETNQSRDQRDEKSLKKLDGNFQRRESFSERKDDPTPVRKRPAFREKKITVDSGEANPAATVAVKSSHTDYPPRNERKEERSSNPNHLDRPEKKIAEDRAPNNREARRDGFSSRVRYGGNGGNSNYRGRDKFNGRQDYHPVKTQTEKWKHDLYQEVNKGPTAKNEDDQIAKLEALLAS